VALTLRISDPAPATPEMQPRRFRRVRSIGFGDVTLIVSSFPRPKSPNPQRRPAMPLRVANLPAEHGKFTKRNPSTRGQKSQWATATSRSRARCAHGTEPCGSGTARPWR